MAIAERARLFKSTIAMFELKIRNKRNALGRDIHPPFAIVLFPFFRRG